MKKCKTHHYACECREEKMKSICHQILKDHWETKQFVSGLRLPEQCGCSICRMIKELYVEGLRQLENKRQKKPF